MPSSTRSVMEFAVLFFLFLFSPLLFAIESYPMNNTNSLRETAPAAQPPSWAKADFSQLEDELIANHGEGGRSRLHRGIRQVLSLWRAQDGSQAEFQDFVRRHFAGDPAALDGLFQRMENLFEQIDGHMAEIGRHLRQQADLDIGPLLPIDGVFAGYDPGAHLADDFFANKIAFAVLLNFPLTTLEERLRDGEGWTRRQWAETRLAQRFSKRIPAEVHLAIAQATAEADAFIAQYNIWMHHLLDNENRRLFPSGLFLLSHWNLRDEIKSHYADAAQGLEKQKIIQQVMERIATQTIPAEVINNPAFDWNPYSNTRQPSSIKDGPSFQISSSDRYAVLRDTFLAARKADPYSPSAPTLIARRFDEDREIPEARVRRIFEELLSSPYLQRTARLIARRVGRPLQPFDIWYNGFRSPRRYSEAELDKIVAQRYPTAEAFEKDIPVILQKLDFPAEHARKIASSIAVDPARGSGHAMGAAMRSAKAHLRTRLGKNGMNYKGYNIAVHELGHNVEQVLTLQHIDHTLLQGVPNTAFTEAFAFVFQARDLDLLGIVTPKEPQEDSLRAINEYWATCEIAAVSLVDMAVWHWMYAHPEAGTAELTQAVLQIAREVWNRFYAPVIGEKDSPILAVYSHMIHSFLYLPDYPLGHLISFQIEEQIRKTGKVGPAMIQMASAGNIAPDLWMKRATGSDVGAQAMLEATGKALPILEAEDQKSSSRK